MKKMIYQTSRGSSVHHLKSAHRMVVAPWYWYLQNSRISTVTRLYLYHHQCNPSWSLIYGKLQLLSMNQYHLWYITKLNPVTHFTTESVYSTKKNSPQRFHLNNSDLFGITANLSVLLNQRQLSQQSKGFTVVVLVSY